MAAYLELKLLEKSFTKNITVVKKINLEVEQGEFIVLLGPSGCGKTTTLRMIAGLESATSGAIFLEGKNITKLAPRMRNLSMVFQSYAVWPHMTVYQNIAYPLKLRGFARNDIAAKISKVAELTEISPYLDRYPNKLSGGQRQRVAVARAIAGEPKLFLMDEPLSNLDAKLRESMRTQLKKIHKSINATSIFVTHDQAEAMSLADRIVIMKDGLIEQIGSADDIYSDCKSLFVAGFIGSPRINAFDVILRKSGTGIVASSDLLSLSLSRPQSRSLENYIDKKVTLTIRPEDLSPTREQDSDILGFCIFQEAQGAHRIINFENSGLDFRMQTEVKDDFENKQVALKIKRENAMFFDPETGVRILEDLH